MADAVPPGAYSAPHVLRNREAIATVLQQRLPTHGLVLELASGSGEHALHNARLFPHLQWQPSDQDEVSLESIAAWRKHAGLPNLLAPLRLDVTSPPEHWPISEAAAVLCFNMVHISPWSATEGMIAGVARVLARGGALFLYGPYFEEGVAMAPSNVDFDRDLRRRDPRWGIRRRDDVTRLASEQRLHFEERITMPANNLMLVYRRPGKTATS